MNETATLPFSLHVLAMLASKYFYFQLLYALCSALLLLAERRAPTNTPRRLPLFALLSLGFFFLMRLPAFFYNAPLNPDEAEMLANARKFSLDMNTWRSVDTGSGGPLDSMVLMWPNLIGRVPGFATARVTSFLLLSGAWIALLCLPVRLTNIARIAGLACLMLVLGGSRLNDYLHYSSEILPLSLIVVSAVLVLTCVGAPIGLPRAALAAFLLGSIPFSKLQAILPALFLGLVLIWLIFRAGEGLNACFRKLVVVIAAACLPAMLILGPLALSGNFIDFWNSYIGFALNYLGGGVGLEEQPSWPNVLEALMAPSLQVLSFFCVMAGLSAVGLVIKAGSIRLPLSASLISIAIAGGLLVSSFIAATAPGRTFVHYGSLLLMPMALFAMLAWSVDPEGQCASPGRIPMPWLIVVSMGSIVLVAAAGSRWPGKFFGATMYFAPAIMAPETFFGSGDLIPDTPDNDGRMLIWGWMADWYVDTRLKPATRDLNSYNQSTSSLLRPYFRDRMMSDLAQTHPRFVVDGVAPGSFYFTDAAQDGLSIFPALKAFVDASYDQISHSPHGDECPRVYARKDAVAEITKRYAAIAAVTASASKTDDQVAFTPDHLIDGVVFETCTDRWLLPDHELGSVDLQLAMPQPLSGVELLNTRNGNRKDRATGTVVITGWNGTSRLWSQQIELKRYPYWTRVAVPSDGGPVSRVNVEVQSYTGVGGGLNEIRLVAAQKT